MGWRVYATNRSSDVFPLTDAVVTYRNSYLIERSFARLKNAPLSLTPIYLQRDDHIKETSPKIEILVSFRFQVLYLSS